jgi:hypothetical protein
VPRWLPGNGLRFFLHPYAPIASNVEGGDLLFTGSLAIDEGFLAGDPAGCTLYGAASLTAEAPYGQR